MSLKRSTISLINLLLKRLRRMDLALSSSIIADGQLLKTSSQERRRDSSTNCLLPNLLVQTKNPCSVPSTLSASSLTQSTQRTRVSTIWRRIWTFQALKRTKDRVWINPLQILPTKTGLKSRFQKLETLFKEKQLFFWKLKAILCLTECRLRMAHPELRTFSMPLLLIQ